MRGDNYCRLCLAEDAWHFQVPIFEGSPFDESLCDIINNFSGINVCLNDGLPDTLCQKCLGVITVFVQFRDTVKKNDKLLKRVLKCLETSKGINFENEDVVNASSEAMASDLKKPRRPGPKSSKMKPREIEDEDVTETESCLGPTTPMKSTDPTELEKATDADISALPITPNSVSSLVELNVSRNLGNSDSPESDRTVVLDTTRHFNQQKVSKISDRLEETDAFETVSGNTIESAANSIEKKNATPARRGRPRSVFFNCDYCSRPFKKRCDRAEHILLHKNLSRKLFMCRFCGMAHGNDIELKNHVSAFHPLVTVDVYKQRDLQIKSALKSAQITTISSSSVNYDLIENAENSETSSNKRKRGDSSKKSQDDSSKKLKFDANESKESNLTIAEVHTPKEMDNPTSEVIAEVPTPVLVEPTANPALTVTKTVEEVAETNHNLIIVSDEEAQPGNSGKAVESPTTESITKHIVCQIPFQTTPYLPAVELRKISIPSSPQTSEKKCNICPFKCGTMKELFHHKRNHKGTPSKQ